MIVACHQPDLLPWSGFFHKMLVADVFVLLPHDQFQKHGYQRRVLMRGSWCSHRLVGKPSLVPIGEVRLHEGWQARMIDAVAGRYQGARFWKERGPGLCDGIAGLDGSDSLAEANIAMIMLLRSVLGIPAEVRLADPSNTAKGTERVIRHVLAVPGATAYLSGTGAKAYMPDAEERFAESGLELRWSHHAHRSPDSVLTALFDEEDALAAVAR